MRRLLIFLLSLSTHVHAEKYDATAFNPDYPVGSSSSIRERICLNGIWEFAPVFDSRIYHLDEFPDPARPPLDGEWSPILVPGFFKEARPDYSGVRLPDGKPLPRAWRNAQRGWYKRIISARKAWGGRSATLRFDGVAYCCKVFVNNTCVGEHSGPVTRFTFDISKALNPGTDNVLSVYVMDKDRVVRVPEGESSYRSWGRTEWHILPEQWQYRRNAAGIWKDVFLEIHNTTFVHDVFAMPSYRKNSLGVRVWVKNDSEQHVARRLTLGVYDKPGNRVLDMGHRDTSIPPRQTNLFEFTMNWADPKLWDIDTPNMYCARAGLWTYDTPPVLIDEKTIGFGFRETWVDGDKIYLNGRILHTLGDWDTDTGLGSYLGYQRYEYAIHKFRSLRRDLNFLAPRIAGMSSYETVFDAADDLGYPLIPTGYAGSMIHPSCFQDIRREWREYITSLRNHPSIIIWSVENEGACHEQTNPRYILQRKLDQILEELDPTRPYYHDGYSLPAPGDRGALYTSGDLCGTAPISGGHYTSPKTPLSRWMHEFDDYHGVKPFIYGEAGTFSHADIPVHVNLFYGSGSSERSDGELAELGGRFTRMVVGAWRSYGIAGINAHGSYQGYNTSYLRVRPGVTALKWDKLNTPGPKVVSTEGGRFNPYVPTNAPCETGEYGRWIARAYAPLLVTLYRDLRHNFFSGEKAPKTAYVVNDTKKDLNVTLRLKLRATESNDVGESGSFDMIVPHGIQVSTNHVFTFPSTDAVLRMKLDATAQTAEKTFRSEDEQDISVYPSDPFPQLNKRYYLYDSDDSLQSILIQAGFAFREFPDREFDNDPATTVLLIGPHAVDQELRDHIDRIDAFVRNGGILVVLNQRSAPNGSESSNVSVHSMKHPVFRGLASSRIYFWAGPDNLVAECELELPPRGRFIDLARMPPPLHDASLKHCYMFEMPNGRGSVLACNLLLTQLYRQEPEARLILHNMLRYADTRKSPEEQDQPAADYWMSIFSEHDKPWLCPTRRPTSQENKRFRTIDLRFQMNAAIGGMEFRGDVVNVRFRRIPLGRWILAGVPFHVIDGDRDDLTGGDLGMTNSGIVLKGREKPEHPLKTGRIPIKQTAHRIHFLHTSTWNVPQDQAGKANHDVVKYVFTYADQSHAETTAVNNIHIGACRVASNNGTVPDLPEARLAWKEPDPEHKETYLTVWTQTWNNPHPEKEISFMEIVSAGASVPLILAVTLEKQVEN